MNRRLFTDFISVKTLAVAACVLGCAEVSAQSLALKNASFEQPFIPEVDFTDSEVLALLDGVTDPLTAQLIIGNLVSRDVYSETPLGNDPQAGWIQTGPSFMGRNSSGMFSNQPINFAPFFVVDPIPNSHGDSVGFDQIGFILADPDANGGSDSGDEDFVSIYQESTDVFVADQDYRFTLAVGKAVTFAAGDTAPLRIAIGTIDDTPGLVGSEVFSELVGLDIFASELDGSGSGELRDFSVDLFAGEFDPVLLGENIAVQIRVAVPDDLEGEDLFNTGGAFNFDHARLVVPEPTSLGLLAVGGALFLRRRR